MSGIFDHPLVLLGFAVFIPFALFENISQRKKRIRNNLPKNLWIKLSASRILFAVFLACLIVALAGPRWGIGQTAGEYRRAVDAVIAVDVSRSMEIRDAYGSLAEDNTGGLSRLERGLSIAAKAAASVPGMRFAVTVSRNRGIVAIPLTWDNSAVLAFLDAIDGSSLTGRGTNLESLIDASAGVFQASHPSNRVIILVSDGEALSGSLKAALGRCNRDGITVTAIAVGSDEGGEVPDGGGIISLRDSDAMQMAARETGGIFIDGSRNDAAEALAGHLRSLAAETYAGKNRQERKSHWLTFAMLAIIAFGASKFSLLRLSEISK